MARIFPSIRDLFLTDAIQSDLCFINVNVAELKIRRVFHVFLHCPVDARLRKIEA